MTLIGPEDEFFAIRGDRPPDGYIDGFAVIDPTNDFGFRQDDEQFPPPPELEALRRREQASSDLSELLSRHRKETGNDLAY